MSDSGDGDPMAAAGGGGEGEGGSKMKFHGYADYENVAVDLRQATNAAIEAIGHIRAKDSQGVGITPRTAYQAKQDLLAIVPRLFYEVRKNAQIDEFGDVYERWSGKDVERAGEGEWEVEDTGEEGYVAMLNRVDFRREVPGWIDQLRDDIVQVGWELGYIRAGVEKPAEPEKDEEQVREMFE